MHTSQSLVRNYHVPRVHLSIRDPLRVFRLFVWLRSMLLECEAAQLQTKRPAVWINPFLPARCLESEAYTTGCSFVVALALSYWCRLPSSAMSGRFADFDARLDYAQNMDTECVAPLVGLGMLPRGSTFEKIVGQSFDHLWKYTADALPAGIVGTQCLKEAFYSIVVAIHTKTAVLLTGPPGCGKSLSFMLASKCLVGKSSGTFLFLSVCVLALSSLGSLLHWETVKQGSD